MYIYIYIYGTRTVLQVFKVLSFLICGLIKCLGSGLAWSEAEFYTKTLKKSPVYNYQFDTS